MNKVFITGVTGQDGSLLAKKMLDEGWQVFGGYRRGFGKLWRLDTLKITDKVNLIDYEIGNGQELTHILKKHNFRQIYHLAGFSRTYDSFNHPGTYMNVNTTGVLEILEACRLEKLDAKIFIAGSSEIFSDVIEDELLDENSLMEPLNPYGVSHVAIRHLVRIYRNFYKLPIIYGILFNHESFLRDSIFITKKIGQFFANAKNNHKVQLEIGNFDAKRDWGVAMEFVHAMHELMLKEDFDDFVFATGKTHSVHQLISAFASENGIETEFKIIDGVQTCFDSKNGRILIKSSEKYLRGSDNQGRAGNSDKLSNKTGIKFTSNINDVVKKINSI